MAVLLSCFSARAASQQAAEEEFDQQSFIMAHVKDAHSFHIADVDGHAVAVPLPVILFGQGGVSVFLSPRHFTTITAERSWWNVQDVVL